LLYFVPKVAKLSTHGAALLCKLVNNNGGNPAFPLPPPPTTTAAAAVIVVVVVAVTITVSIAIAVAAFS
jgi:hypothetical protein